MEGLGRELQGSIPNLQPSMRRCGVSRPELPRVLCRLALGLARTFGFSKLFQVVSDIMELLCSRGFRLKQMSMVFMDKGSRCPKP